MLTIDDSRIADTVRRMSDHELLDRFTAYRAGMEVGALHEIESELAVRGISQRQIADYRSWLNDNALWDSDEIAYRCCKCGRPAIAKRLGWRRLFGAIPLIPQRRYYCVAHADVGSLGDDSDAPN